MIKTSEKHKKQEAHPHVRGSCRVGRKGTGVHVQNRTCYWLTQPRRLTFMLLAIWLYALRLPTSTLYKNQKPRNFRYYRYQRRKGGERIYSHTYIIITVNHANMHLILSSPFHQFKNKQKNPSSQKNIKEERKFQT